MKQKSLMNRLGRVRSVVVWMMVVLGCLGLLGAVLLGGLLYAFSGEKPGSEPSQLVFWFGFLVSAGPSVLMLLGAWLLSKRKLVGWIIAVVVGVPFGWYLVNILM